MNKKLNDIFNQYIEYQKNEILETSDIINSSNDFITVDFDINSNLPDFKFKHVLYYFEIPENFSAEHICKVIQKQKDKMKKKTDEFKLPKVNFDNAKISGNNILYVGKSSGNFSTRLKQHIGKESKKTYALHLKEWKKMFEKDVKLKLHFVTFEGLMDKENKHLLEIIETSLHYKLKPILGRTGH